ncbi:MAG: flavodoxin family protein [Desulfonatronovibrio sp.]
MSNCSNYNWESIKARYPAPAVLGIGGSPRKSGNSDVLLDAVISGVAAVNLPCKKIHLRDYYYQACMGCEKCRKDKICTGLNDGMTLLYPYVYESRGLVLMSPAHNYNITAWMKAFIDRLYCFYDFADTRPRQWSNRLAGQGRKAVLAAVGEQEDEYDMGLTLEAMRRPVEAMGYEVVGELPVFGIFDRGKVREHEEVMESAAALGRKLAESL